MYRLLLRNVREKEAHRDDYYRLGRNRNMGPCAIPEVSMIGRNRYLSQHQHTCEEDFQVITEF